MKAHAPAKTGTRSGASRTREELRDLLSRVRDRTLLLMATVPDHDAVIQHDPLMSPIVWDLGHITAFESLWLKENLSHAVQFSEMPGMYDPFENPRAARASLPLPSLAAALQELDRVRTQTWEMFDRVDLESSEQLLANGYVYRMVAQHESQHQETILQTLQLKKGEPYSPPARRLLPDLSSDFRAADMVTFPGSAVEIGTTDRSAAYDNERPLHTVELRPFSIDVTPVTNAAYLEFMRDAGYSNPEFWSREGRAWLEEGKAVAPKYWTQRDGEWVTREMDIVHLVMPDAPVIHVCFYEAEAYARYRGKRLPTEFEWEAAATWDPKTRRRKFPWGEGDPGSGLANIDQLAFGTARAGAFSANVSPLGCHGMIGDVWEWTSSCFQPYPGFESFPYAEYSEVFFGEEYRVLRGGSWATAPHVARATFRNWDYPIRRQIFAGFRCARDA